MYVQESNLYTDQYIGNIKRQLMNLNNHMNFGLASQNMTKHLWAVLMYVFWEHCQGPWLKGRELTWCLEGSWLSFKKRTDKIARHN